MFFVYILESRKTGKFYIGQTNNLELRVKRHNSGKVLSTRSGIPWRIVLYNEYNTRKEAITIERQMKSLKKRGSILEFANRNKFRGIAQSG
jgi:putative endonuclease